MAPIWNYTTPGAWGKFSSYYTCNVRFGYYIEIDTKNETRVLKIKIQFKDVSNDAAGITTAFYLTGKAGDASNNATFTANGTSLFGSSDPAPNLQKANYPVNPSGQIFKDMTYNSATKIFTYNLPYQSSTSVVLTLTGNLANSSLHYNSTGTLTYTQTLNIGENQLTSSAININANGTGTNNTTPYVNVSGTWKKATAIWVNVNGTWKQASGKVSGTATLTINAAPNESIEICNGNTTITTVTANSSGVATCTINKGHYSLQGSISKYRKEIDLLSTSSTNLFPDGKIIYWYGRNASAFTSASDNTLAISYYSTAMTKNTNNLYVCAAGKYSSPYFTNNAAWYTSSAINTSGYTKIRMRGEQTVDYNGNSNPSVSIGYKSSSGQGAFTGYVMSAVVADDGDKDAYTVQPYDYSASISTGTYYFGINAYTAWGSVSKGHAAAGYLYAIWLE